MKINITNGEVTLKTKYTHKMKKEISNALFNGESKAENISPQDLERANMCALKLFVEMLVIDGQEHKEITEELLDELEEKDFMTILGEVNKLTSTELPKEQKAV